MYVGCFRQAYIMGKVHQDRYPQAGKRKSAGTTNALRTLGKKAGSDRTLLCDCLKCIIGDRGRENDLPGGFHERIFCPCSVCMRQQDAFSDIIFRFLPGILSGGKGVAASVGLDDRI